MAFGMSNRVLILLLGSLPTAVYLCSALLSRRREAKRRMHCKCIRSDGPRTIVLTGATGGIGRELLAQFLAQDCRVIVGARDMNKAKLIIEDIRLKCVPKCGTAVIIWLDFSFLSSVRDFVQHVVSIEDRVHILVNNAAVFRKESRMRLTVDGFEEHFQVNYLGPMLLCELLLPSMYATPATTSSFVGKIVNITSSLANRIRTSFSLLDVNFARTPYSPSVAYMRSKFALNLYSRELGRRISQNGVRVLCVNPGVVVTDMHRRRSPNYAIFLLWKLAGLFLFNSAEHVGRELATICLCEGEQNETKECEMIKLNRAAAWPQNVDGKEHFAGQLDQFSRKVCLLEPLRCGVLSAEE